MGRLRMHIALVNAFPFMPGTAEVEYIRRFKLAAERLGHKAYEVVTSDDIHDCAPDFVIATHEFTPKLTPHFTVGALWSPPSFYATDPLRVRSILSHDAYLVGSTHVSRFLDDLEFSTGIAKPRSDFTFLPTAAATDFLDRKPGLPYELVYVGVHWDGSRHGRLLDLLSAGGDISFYGPAPNWQGHPNTYRGEVPYDGVSMQRVLAQHGIVLCLHKDDHRAADTPSMRLFEAAAAGCLIITDEIPFAARTLGDSVFRLDLRRDPAENATAIRDIVAWANANPDRAGAMARQSHAILRRDFSLEASIERCCAFVETAKTATTRRYSAGVARIAERFDARDKPLVDIVLRTGGRGLDQVRRAIRSVADQRFGRFRIILADYKGRDDIVELARAEATPRLTIDYLRCENNGLRSTTLWTGLRQVQAPYFAMLDDDDSLMPDHFAHLFATADAYPDHPLYYSGVVRVEEDPVQFMTAPNFRGPMDIVVPEVRELKFMDRFDLVRLLGFDNYIQSNAWIGRSSCLDERLMVDPQLVVCEDMYLYFMLSRHGSFRLSPSPTAYWNWRSAGLDNSMNGVAVNVWRGEGNRILMRLDQEMTAEGLRIGPIRQLTHLLPARPVESDQKARLRLGAPAVISTLVLNREGANLHHDEDAGVWTAGSRSVILMRSEEALATVEIAVTLMVAGTKRRPQYLRLSINDQLLFEGRAEPWQQLEARGRIAFVPAARVLTLVAECAYTHSPQEQTGGHDPRQLGILLGTISCARIEEPALAALGTGSP